MRVSAAIAKSKLPGLAQINQGAEVIIYENVNLGVARKILQTYRKVLQYSLLLRHNKVILLYTGVLQNISTSQKKHFKKRIN